MDKTKPPGIKIEAVDLLSCNIGDIAPDRELRYSLGLDCLKRVVAEDGKTLTLLACFDLMQGVEEPAFSFSCTYAIHYTMDDENPNMTWDEFNDGTALAHAIPYVRELITNLTTRLPLPTLMLPPTNAHSLVEAYRATPEPN